MKPCLKSTISSMAINIREVELGVVLPKPISPHFKTEPLYIDGVLKRNSQLGVYLRDQRDNLVYTAFILGLNPIDFSMDQEYLTIIRNVKELQKKSALDRQRRIAYLEQRVCIGDLVCVHAQKKANNPAQFYLKFLSYDAFLDCEPDDRSFIVELGEYTQAAVYEIGPDHKTFNAIPIYKITRETFENNRNRIIRMHLGN